MATKTKKPEAGICNCLELANKELAASNTRLVQDMEFNTRAMTAGMTKQIKLATEKIDTKKKQHANVYATYCPICGKKYQR